MITIEFNLELNAHVVKDLIQDLTDNQFILIEDETIKQFKDEFGIPSSNLIHEHEDKCELLSRLFERNKDVVVKLKLYSKFIRETFGIGDDEMITIELSNARIAAAIILAHKQFGNQLIEELLIGDFSEEVYKRIIITLSK